MIAVAIIILMAVAGGTALVVKATGEVQDKPANKEIKKKAWWSWSIIAFIILTINIFVGQVLSMLIFGEKTAISPSYAGGGLLGLVSMCWINWYYRNHEKVGLGWVVKQSIIFGLFIVGMRCLVAPFLWQYDLTYFR